MITSTVDLVSEYPEDWHPVNAQEAQEYIAAHQDGSGDPDLLEECESFQGRPVHKPA
jgi:hypothetical protein